MNGLANSLKKFFTNKNTVTIIGVVAILFILYFLYTKKINDATNEETVFVAARTINPQTQITNEDVTTIKVAKAARPDGVILDKKKIVGKYTGVGSTIPEGSMFYDDVIVEKEELPGDWLTLLEKDANGNLEIPYYFSVNTTTTFGNSIQPGDYVDFYVKMYDQKQNNKLIFGKLIENVKILAVTESSGKDVFRSQTDIGTPAYLNFGLSRDNYNLFKTIDYANGADITLIVVPHGGAIPEENLEITISQTDLRDKIKTDYLDKTYVDDKYEMVEENVTDPNAQSNQNNPLIP